MGLRPTDLPLSAPYGVEGVHRVERPSEAHDFDRRQPSGRKGGGSHPEPEESPQDEGNESSLVESARRQGCPAESRALMGQDPTWQGCPEVHDIVEVSAQYQTEQRAHPEEAVSSPPPPEDPLEPVSASERHLDIQA